ncbi:OLC1v1000217C2 [Oldenlandia corymbosa var. corymbosa]|uniref:OLC1v1000217C2 n=1 Tax=Oldenlandia corymbosa var. corymbosa TaxID=529605 RepID=A0AAV1D2C1_OLDCO|nr:OLC1v1000217C2 [Oldenlandia corymbosa var. corymbosa]
MKFKQFNPHYLRPLLKPPSKPAPAAISAVRHLCIQTQTSSEDPSPSPPSQSKPKPKPFQEILSIIQTTNPDEWSANTHLHYLLLSASPTSLLKITRQLGSSQKSLLFFDHLKTKINSSSPTHNDGLFPLSFAFQGVLELAAREEGHRAPAKMRELFHLSKEQKIPLSINAATLLIKSFGQAKMLEEAMNVFEELDPESRNIYLVNLLLDYMLKSGEVDGALKVFEEILDSELDVSPDKNTLEIFLSAFLTRNWVGRSLREEEIFRIVSECGEHGVFPNSVWLTQLITRIHRNGELDKAWELLHEVMRLGGNLKAAPCNALLTGLGKERDFKRMNLLMQEMKEKDIQPDVLTFGILINHLCKFHRVDEALEMFGRMKGGNVEEGSDLVVVEPDVVIYNTLIDGLCKVGRIEEALELMENMMTLKGGCKPNTVTYNSLLDGLCKAGEIRRAFELFDRMSKAGVDPNVITLNTLLDGMCRSEQVGSAMDFFDEMQGRGLKVNAITYTILITAFCGANNIDKAFSLFDQMVQSGCFPDAKVYYSLISGLTQSGRMDDALFLVSKLKEAGFCLDIISYNVLIGGFCKKNRLDEAYDFFKEMEHAGLKPDRVTYNTLISHFCGKGDFTTARNVLKNMKNVGLVPNVVTFGALIDAYCKAGYLDEAMKLYRDMSVISKVSANTVIYNILIDAHCKSDKIEVALSLLDDMKSKQVKPCTITYNALLKGLKERNMLEKAFTLMNEMTENACNPDYITLEVLTRWLSAAGQLKNLRRFVQGFEVDVLHVPSFINLFTVLPEMTMLRSAVREKDPEKGGAGENRTTAHLLKYSEDFLWPTRLEPDG